MSATSGNKNPRLAVVLLLGIDGAGKTTLLGTLQGDHDPRVRPSVGFKPVTMMLSDQLKVGPRQVGDPTTLIDMVVVVTVAVEQCYGRGAPVAQNLVWFRGF